MIYFIIGVLLAYLLYLYISANYLTNSCNNSYDNSLTGSNTNSLVGGNSCVFLSGSDKNAGNFLSGDDKNFLSGDNKNAGNFLSGNDRNAGMNILTYLGLGPADQDQLNIINHKDHNNLAWILRRPLNPPRKLINNLTPSNSSLFSRNHDLDNAGLVAFKTLNACNCDVGIVNLDRPPTELEGVTPAIAKRLVSNETHNILYGLSPDFMRTDLKQYYGGLYYNDVRYPERPISIEFAKDPAGYCLRHPQEYPCPLISSRIDIH